ncbi:hypothetical protein AM571_CH02377 [Rhizobium etli 8C-3]|uniref:Uncharacterized protein n=2 Tax=Rhizobium TaxID=379 RepID=A0A1L5P4W2_RHIET|nr:MULTISPECIES: hypothetical protein [Rhizobium]APO75186.1 hypothetical protein AM571_CH02377 [Rhizobium etli 8C-3]TCU25673.1 hypothetical protein EV130_105331 [Rhizobium azibense]
MSYGSLSAFGDTWCRYRPDTETLEAAHDLVDRYLAFAEEAQVGNDIIDEIELPVPKPMLIKSFGLVIAAEHRPQIRALLIRAGMTLAQYRADLGPRMRLKPTTPHGRLRAARSREFERRLQKKLVAVAEERISLGAFYRRAFIEAMH